MRCAVLVGRDEEVTRLRSRVAATRHAGGGVVALVGEAGAGKSRLLNEVIGAASAEDVPILSGRSVPSESLVAYRPLAEAFFAAFRSRVLPEDPALEGFTVALGQLVPAWAAEVGAVEASPLLLAEAVVRLLRVLAADGAVVLLVEDIHWADSETLMVVEYLVEALRGTAVLCVVTSRPDPASVDLLTRIGRRDPDALMRIDALSEEQVDDMVRACLGVATSPAGLAPFVRAHSDGNPFLVEELLAGLVASGDLRVRDGHWELTELRASVPASLRDSIRHRMRGLDASARRVVAAAALLGRHFEWELLPGIADVDARAAIDGLRAAVDEQLIVPEGNRFMFRHALTREAVLADLLPPERQELAKRAWPVVERANPALPGPTCELAAELAEAAGDAAAAATRLVTSARRSLAAGALATGESTARRAVRLAGTDPAQPMAALDAEEMLVDVLVAAGKAREALGRGEGLMAMAERAACSPSRVIDLRLTLARAAITAGDIDAAEREVSVARTAASTADSGVAARLEAVAAHVAIERGQIEGALATARRARELAQLTDQPAVECDALLVLGRAVRTTGFEASTHVFAQAAELAEKTGLASWHLRAQQELALDGWNRGDASALHETRAIAARYGALASVAVVDLTLADLALSTFDRDGCLRAASACVEASRRYHLATERVANLWLAGAHALAGDDHAMRRAIDASLANDSEDPRILADLYGRVLPTRAVVADDLDALPALLDAMIKHVETAPRHASVYPGRMLWALLHTIDDDDFGAEPRARLADAAAQYGLMFFVLGHQMVEAVAAGRRGDTESATERFEAAYETVCSTPVGFGMVQVYVPFFARAAMRDGWGDPVRWLRTAEASFSSGGYERIARRCRLLIGQAGAPVPRRSRGAPPVPPSLRAIGVTSREADVLKLVVAGRTNKQIAQILVVSPKTVERHLSSLFTRFGVADRRALAAAAGERVGRDAR